MTSDIFDDVLNLEEQYHEQGYQQGYADGAEAGRIEGRSVGLKAGFEKFLEAGRLQGRAIVWANRISNDKPENTNESPDDLMTTKSLPALSGSNKRLEKNIATLYGLVEPGTLSTENDDEAVNDFDSRLKGAQGKMKIIERSIGEKTGDIMESKKAAPMEAEQNAPQ